MNNDQQKDLIEWCSRYKMCKGCPLVGQCIAPLVDADSSKWNEWIEKMHGKIMDFQQY